MKRSRGSLIVAVCTATLLTATSGGAQAPAPQAAAPAAPQAGRGGGPAPDACGGRSNTPREACANDVTRMIAALPATAPAKPARPRKVLVLASTSGFVHSSIPLAAKMMEEMGKKTGAWTADVTYDRAQITAENLAQYDLLFLDSTTGTFLDEPNSATDPAAKAKTDARRKALLDFVRGGKGIAGIHAATDSYHGRAGGAPGGAGRAGGGAGRAGGAPAAPPAPCTSNQTQGAAAGGDPLWPEFNKMIGGYFKFHWNYPTPITVKIDDPSNPINAAFKGKSFNTIDEVYTFAWDSFSRDNVRVLTSVDYNLMSDCDKGIESNRRPDQDYALSWVKREGQGRVFVNVLGHNEAIYYNNPAMLEHILAGVQYALGDLKADDTPVPLKR
jgi:type 1 glutamine amidotransferase